jgi:ADP-ribosyl-[dinitrogen reductase] hydrolase
MERPLPNSYWVVPGRFLAGEHPVGRQGRHEDGGRARVELLLAAGISCFVDLTEEGECQPYELLLPATAGYLRHPIRDQKVPRRAGQMRRIQGDIGAALAAGRGVYLHCRAGIGRTGMVAGCFLVEQGLEGEHALRTLNELWTAQSARAATWPEIPQTIVQADYIRHWLPGRAGSARPRRITRLWSPAAAERGALGADMEITESELAPVRGLRDRFQGALHGLAIGDALAAATQFRRAGSFAPVGDLIGGGPFDLPRGAWSDDTAVALCLAESLAVREVFDPADQLERYRRWQREGRLSATGHCLGITAAMARALAAADKPGREPGGSQSVQALDPEPLSRVAPVVMHGLADPDSALLRVAEAARFSCRTPAVLDACRLLAAMLHAALSGEPLSRVLSPRATLFAAQPLQPDVAAIAASPAGEGDPVPGGSGALAALAQARWCLARTANFRDGALRAVNLGGDSDVVGAVYGQLAGAHYGLTAIPPGWRRALAQQELIADLADRLLRSALVQLGEAAVIG